MATARTESARSTRQPAASCSETSRARALRTSTSSSGRSARAPSRSAESGESELVGSSRRSGKTLRRQSMKNPFRQLFAKPEAPPAGPLAADGQLASDLWIDRPDAAERLAGMRSRGEVTAEEADRLRHFIERGYLTFSLGALEAEAQALADDVERAWRDKPADLAYAWQGPLRSFAYADRARDRRPSYRIADLHSHSESALALYLNPAIFRMIELALGSPAVATQSLAFEWGSQQGLHRDPVFVQTQPPSHLIAAWFALEDVDPESGPLVYVPGSHRLPYYQFEPGQFLFDQSRYGPNEAEAMAAFDRARCAAAGLEAEPLLCPRGTVR